VYLTTRLVLVLLFLAAAVELCRKRFHFAIVFALGFLVTAVACMVIIGDAISDGHRSVTLKLTLKDTSLQQQLRDSDIRVSGTGVETISRVNEESILIRCRTTNVKGLFGQTLGYSIGSDAVVEVEGHKLMFCIPLQEKMRSIRGIPDEVTILISNDDLDCLKSEYKE
jgi:hypothetical protein